MKRFAALLRALRTAEDSAGRIEHFKSYLGDAPEQDRVWAAAILNGRRPRRLASTAEIRLWAAEAAGLPDWLIASSEAAAGDFCETISLILPLPDRTLGTSLADCMGILLGSAGQSQESRKRAALAAWRALGINERHVFTSLAAGRFRTMLAPREIVSALAQVTGTDLPAIAHRLAGNWSPATLSYASLVGSNEPATDSPSPTEFTRIGPLSVAAASLGPPEDWFADLGFSGTRAQLCVGKTSASFWSDDFSMVREVTPAVQPELLVRLAGSILDGVIVTDPHTPTRHFVAHDLLMVHGTDLRARPFADRRTELVGLMADMPPGQILQIAEEVPFQSWDDLATRQCELRASGAACIYLRRHRSTCLLGGSLGNWLTWAADPFHIAAALIYVELRPGNSRNDAPLLTFAVRDGPSLVPITKLEGDLAPGERPILEAWIRQNTVERFGPVRSLLPTQVFELSFDAVTAAPRRKSGIVLVGPKLLRWCREDQPVAVADLKQLQALLSPGGHPIERAERVKNRR